MSKLGLTGGSLIVAGTSIGAGMLGLPVVIAPSGFIPSLIVLTACWAFMCSTGLLFAELSCSYKERVNILSMATRSFGASGKVFALLVYLFLFYCLAVAYFVGGGSLLSTIFSMSLGVQERVFVFALLFIPIVAFGKRVVDPINRISMWGLLATYVAFSCTGISSINTTYLSRSDWDLLWLALPISFVSFAYQGTIPTLASWVEYDKKLLKKSIVIGTLITLAVYLFWVVLILGIVPFDGKEGLQEAYREGHDAIHALQFAAYSQYVALFGKAFAFFAIVTSFLGVGIGLVDFFADAFGIEKKRASGLISLLFLSFFVPLVFSLTYPHLFLEALGYAGGFGSSLLLGALPIAMVWKAKYRQKMDIEDSFINKKSILSLLFLFVVIEIVCECAHLLTR